MNLYFLIIIISYLDVDVLYTKVLAFLVFWCLIWIKCLKSTMQVRKFCTYKMTYDKISWYLTLLLFERSRILGKRVMRKWIEIHLNFERWNTNKQQTSDLRWKRKLWCTWNGHQYVGLFCYLSPSLSYPYFLFLSYISSLHQR